jgi:hypothetical protein
VQHAIAHAQGRADLVGAGHARFIGAGRNRHGVRGHQGPDMVGIGVAQGDIGQFMVHQVVLAALVRLSHAMQRHGEDAPLRRVVVTVGVPADAVVGIGDELAAPGSLRVLVLGREAGDAVLVRQPVGVQAGQAELGGEPARSFLVLAFSHPRGVDGHVGLGDQAP